ncbi:MAG: hypothetical protein IJM92_11440 [Fibrobacter sp.]|uniref:hypothetical protein n=1 Tax=Fibrobacter sp. TaxID=35828 RepID=UPI0025C09516|nr:hypothetical protein [Fibrobacter sp.]MBQ7080244.1 hypothetical protein [Fibrobacter sp.]
MYIANSLWYPVGEEAILELREESQKESYLRYEKPDNDYNEDSLFTVSKTFVAINFLNIMTSCVLLQKRDENVWVDYYVFFVKLLLECIDESRKNTAAKTLAYFFIQKICCCLNELLALAVKMNCETNRFLVNNQMNQIKDVIHDTSKLTDADKGNIVDSLRINLGQ